jgi:hypothetical protein
MAIFTTKSDQIFIYLSPRPTPEWNNRQRGTICLPYSEGDTRGLAIKPLHPNVPEACLNDSDFYALMAMCNVIRVGRAHEKNIALAELIKSLRNLFSIVWKQVRGKDIYRGKKMKLE